MVGIDLGTSNTVVACALPGARRGAAPTVFEVPQLVTARELAPRPLFPSVLYAPLAGEVDVATERGFVAGAFARDRGVEVPGRSVVSAKSWLGHGAVDRRAPILPWGAGDDVPRLSPVDASAEVLGAIVRAWDAAHPSLPLAAQDVVLTVPASFDADARALTLEAAERVGLGPTLLEEPQAAFYDAWARGAELPEDGLVLVVDVGGGTTDLALLRVAAGGAVERLATGRHLLLGGDNVDLFLAHLAEERLGARLEPARFAQLAAACRAAKERLFAADGPPQATVTVLGQGSRLVGGATTVTLERARTLDAVLAGFFPATSFEEVRAAKPPRAALQAFGLPYERDPAITRHVAAFLARHGGARPAAVLFNGGLFHAPALVDATVRALGALDPASPGAPRVLDVAAPDLAVARGAVLHGLARRGERAAIAGGSPRAYYVAVDGGAPAAGAPVDAAPGARAGRRLVCVLPRGAADDELFAPPDGPVVALATGTLARFEPFTSDVAADAPPAVVTAGDDHVALAPLVAAATRAGAGGAVPSRLEARLRPGGLLEVACRSVEDPREVVALQFDVRGDATARAPSVAPASLAPRAVAASSREARALAPSLGLVDAAFGKKGASDAKLARDVPAGLERALGERATWSLETCRAVADALLANPGGRRRTPEHERTYWALLGFALRPGFGDPGDAERARVVATTIDARLAFPDEARGWQQLFVALRRVAAGFDEGTQTKLRDAFDGWVAPRSAGKKAPKRAPEARAELWQLLAALERVPPRERHALGEWLFEAELGKLDAGQWAVVGRIGARVPLHASAHHVVPADDVAPWIERLLRERWEGLSTAPHAATQLARVTGDRARDVGPALRAKVVARLEQAKAKPAWIACVRELVAEDAGARAEAFGESLPAGLRLLEAT